MADTELHETDSEDQKDWQAETDADVKDTDTNETDANETDEADDDYGVSMDKVQAVLNATADKSEMTPQMQRMMSRQAENTRRVEETIKGTKSNPRWFVPLFCAPDLGRGLLPVAERHVADPGYRRLEPGNRLRDHYGRIHHDDVVALSGEIPSRQPAPYRR